MAVGCAFTLVRGRQTYMDVFSASLRSPYRAARSSLGLVIAPQVLSEANGDYGGSFGS